ncbi:hypothetical protein [Blautia sp. HCP28S3_G10]|uniref:hypothetical protein n=1 Tax=Blautia sp. HCP28S3_G10 TaxID=3438908 RepID=UPI003F8BAD0A
MAKNNTIFDDVFRTMIEKMPELVIPLINEVFGTNYPMDIPIMQQRNEHQTKDGEIITDSNLCIGNLIYHIECQSTSNSTMIIRMVQYDFSIAMDYAEKRDGKYYMEFPQSCVLYLRGKGGPDFLEMVMVMPDGRKMEYQVPVVHVQAYTKDELFQKKLIFLLPFYIMRYEKNRDQAETDPVFQEGILKEYADIEEYLEEELLDQDREQAYRDMIELIRKIADYIFADRKKVKERLGDIMGGKVLELESDKLIKLGRAEGRAEAQQQAIRNLVTSMNLTVKQAMDALGIPEEERYKYVDGLKQK